MTLLEVWEAYNPYQPRDARGRWTTSGAAVASVRKHQDGRRTTRRTREDTNRATRHEAEDASRARRLAREDAAIEKRREAIRKKGDPPDHVKSLWERQDSDRRAFRATEEQARAAKRNNEAAYRNGRREREDLNRTAERQAADFGRLDQDKVRIEKSERKAVAKQWQQMGMQTGLDKAGEIAGAQPGSVTTLSSGAFGVRVHVEGPGGYTATRELTTDASGKVYAKNDFSQIPKADRGQGLGTKIFSDQVDGLAKNGVDRVTMLAARGGEMNGYYSWARMGADADIGAVRQKLPKELQSATRVSDLMKTPAGRAAWKEHGTTMHMTFDLKPDSTSRRVLADYKKEKGLR